MNYTQIASFKRWFLPLIGILVVVGLVLKRNSADRNSSLQPVVAIPEATVAKPAKIRVPAAPQATRHKAVPKVSRSGKGSHPDRNKTIVPGDPIKREGDRRETAVVLDSRDEPGKTDGELLRIKLVQTDEKYPLLRVEETIKVDQATEEEIVIGSVAMVADHIMVQLKPGTTEDEFLALNKKHGGVVRKKMSAEGLYLVQFAAADIDTVITSISRYNEDSGKVKYAEPDYMVYRHATIPNDPDFGQLWGMNNTGQSGGTADADIDAAEAWDSGTGTDIIVAVIDTGVDYDHVDLVGNIWSNAGEIAGNGIDDDGNGYIDDIHGIDVYNNDTDPKDDHDHGTHCSGTIAGVGNNNVAIAGVCWSARIMGVKFLSAGGSGSTSDAIECIDYAAMMGARVMNNSWGGGGFSQGLEDAISRANQANSLFCAAAGNSASDNDSYAHYPSTYTNDNIIAVAASDRNDALSYFSCYGLTSVDLAAPGSAILSTTADDRYATWNGTSMATPHVSGAAALLLSRNPQLTVAQLKAALMDKADPKPAFAGKMVSGARLNVMNSLSAIYGVAFDQSSYFADSWALVTATDTNLAGQGTYDVTLMSDGGDLETLTLVERAAGDFVMTNSIWIGYGAAVPGNGSIEGVHGTTITCTYSNGARILTSTAVIDLCLDIKITSPATSVPFSTTNIQVSGINNGSVLVNMSVVNEATGESKTFSETNLWTTPSVGLASDRAHNVIRVSGTNIYGFSDSDTVTITRRGPAGTTNYVSKTGANIWPYLTLVDASTSLGDAITAAAIGNVVLVNDGTYIGEEAILDRAITMRSINGSAVTIIDGDYDRRCVSITANALVDGFTLTQGWEDEGGAVYMSDGELRNCIVSWSSAYDFGGGVYCYYGGLINNCVIEGNDAYDGGGVELDHGGVISNSTIVDNWGYRYGGGVDCFESGAVHNCSISSNWAGWYGGGVECFFNGEINNSSILDNMADGDGGGIECYWGEAGSIVVNNTLIGGNIAEGYGGGVDMWGGGELNNCTVVGNTSARGGGVYTYRYYAVDLKNTIIYFNSSSDGANYYNSGSGENYTYSCTTPAITGTGNITNAPEIVGVRDYHLLSGSPCIDAGNDAYAFSTDLDGETRISGTAIDIGCDEFVAAGMTGPLSVNIIPDATSIAADYTINLSSDVKGKALSLSWNYGSGAVFSNAAVVSYSWPAPGDYDVVLTAYNLDNPGGVSATTTIHVADAVAYVSLTGGNTPPYSSWATAARNIQAAINASALGGRVIVADGVYSAGSYSINSITHRVGIYKALTVESANGPAAAIIQGVGPVGAGAIRCAYLTEGAVLSGFTLREGHSSSSGNNYTQRSGGGAYLDRGGVVSNCVIRECETSYRGGGVLFYMGGTVVDSVISNNYSSYYGGGAVCYYGGEISHSTISSNSAYSSAGGIQCYYGGIIDRCTIKENKARYNGGGVMLYRNSSLNNSIIRDNTSGSKGGGVYLSNSCGTGGNVNNCTVIGNSSDIGGGVYCYYCGDIRNTIVYYNTANTGPNYENYGSTFNYDYTCTTPAITGTGNITNIPLIVSMKDPHLLLSSSCIDAGSDSYASSTDIDGEARITGSSVDIGCDEFLGSGITGAISVAILTDTTNVSQNFSIELSSDIQGRVSQYVWNIGGSMYTNLPFMSYSWATPGDYPVVLTAYNADFPGGVSATITIHVIDSTSYVSTTGGNVPPYASWATAARNIQDAINAAPLGGTIIVANGVYNNATYATDGSLSRVGLYKPVVVKSLNGPEFAFIEGTGPLGNSAVRGAYLTEGATLSGFTITNGHTLYSGDYQTIRNGGGVYLDEGGVVSNCVITGCESSYRGGGVYAYYGGTVVDCVISNNESSYSGGGAACFYGGEVLRSEIIDNYSRSYGGGVQAYYGGVFDRCVIEGNSSDTDGGGAYLYRDTFINNCLIRNNRAGGKGGGVYLSFGGDVQNCTIIDNTSSIAGGIYSYYYGDVRNSVIYYNSADTGPNYDSYSTAYNRYNYDNNCTVPAVPAVSGTGNITNAPMLVSLADPHILSSSPCIDAGDDSYASSLDIDGEVRISGTAVDIGCDEYIAAGITGALAVVINTDSTTAAVDFICEFASGIMGKAQSYVWEFGGSVTFTNIPVLSYTWASPGSYPVTLTAYNVDYPGGVTTTVTINVVNSTSYVSPSGSDTPPYSSWGTAARNIQSAIDAAPYGGTVIVGDGVYNGGSYYAAGSFNRIGICKPLLVRSSNGPDVTTIEGAGPVGSGAIRCAYLTEGAVLSGFTLREGHTTWSGDYYTALNGGGVYMDEGGEVSNCVIAANESYIRGGGVYCYYGGKVSDCDIINNHSRYYGGGVSTYYGGEIVRCIIATNTAVHDGGGAFLYYGGIVTHSIIENNSAGADGGGVEMNRDTKMNNTLVRFNSAGDEGGGIHMYYGGEVNLCTIANNSSDIAGGVYFRYYGDVSGSIVFNNTANTSSNYFYYGSSASCEYTCIAPLAGLPAGSGCTDKDPLFVDAVASNHRLEVGSPCIDKGINNEGILYDLDMFQRERDGDTNGVAVVDMGAYEHLSPNLDSDGDGMPDSWELAYGLNPYFDDSALDPDFDGRDNLQEYQEGTNPNAVDLDSDDDGLLDGYEKNISFTDPDNPDSDGDGLLDGYEVNVSLTDPNNPDSDGDGLVDGKEVFETLTDPNDIDSDDDGLTDYAEVIAYRLDPNDDDTDDDGITDDNDNSTELLACYNIKVYDPANGTGNNFAIRRPDFLWESDCNPQWYAVEITWPGGRRGRWAVYKSTFVEKWTVVQGTNYWSDLDVDLKSGLYRWRVSPCKVSAVTSKKKKKKKKNKTVVQYGPWTPYQYFNVNVGAPVNESAVISPLATEAAPQVIASLNDMKFQWTVVPKADNYNVEIYYPYRGSWKLRSKTVVSSNDVVEAPAGTMTMDPAPDCPQGTYRWRVYGSNMDGNGPINTNPATAWGYFNVTIAPPAAVPVSSLPSGVQTTARPEFVWTKTASTTKYLVKINYYKKRGYKLLKQITVTADDWTELAGNIYWTPDFNLSSGTLYSWQVSAANCAGTSLNSVTKYFTVNPVKPGTPVLRSPNGVTLDERRLVFLWRPVAGADAYNVSVEVPVRKKRRTIWTTVAGGIVTSNDWVVQSNDIAWATSAALPNTGTYRWRVQALNQGYGGDWSTEGTFTIIPMVVPDNASVAAPAGDRMPVFEWDPVDGARSYVIEITYKKGKKWRTYLTKWVDHQIGATPQTWTASDNYGLISTLYMWRVAAWNEDGYGTWTPHSTFSIVAPQPSGIPQALSPIGGGVLATNKPQFTWTGINNASGYYLRLRRVGTKGYYRQLQNGALVTESFSNTTNLTPEAALISGSYTWWVRGWNPDGFSGYSTNVASFIIP